MKIACYIVVSLTMPCMGMELDPKAFQLMLAKDDGSAQAGSKIPSPAPSPNRKKYNYWYGLSKREDYQSESVTIAYDALDRRDNALFAVIDGHNGNEAAQIVAKRLPIYVRGLPSQNNLDIHLRLFAYLELEMKDIRPNTDSGVCLVSTYHNQNMCYLTWLGNLRGLIVREGKPILATSDHTRSQLRILHSLSKSKRNLLKETEGCETIKIPVYSQSFGDRALKESGVLNNEAGFLQQQLCNNDFVVLGSASLWAALSNECVATLITDGWNDKLLARKLSQKEKLAEGATLEAVQSKRDKLNMLALLLRQKVAEYQVVIKSNHDSNKICSPTVIIIQYEEKS